MANAAEHARYRHEQKDQQPVVGAAARGNRDDRKPLPADLRRHVLADQRGTDRRQRINEYARQNADQQAQRRENQHRGERIGIGFGRGFSSRRARAAEEGHAVSFDETGSASAAASASSAPTAGIRSFSPQDGSCGLSRMAWKVSHSETKPLSGGSAEIAAQPIRTRNAVLRHAMNEAAEMLHVAFAGRGQHRAGAEEQQALEQRMVEDVQQRGGQRQRRGKQHAVRLEGERKAETDEDDADVLDRMIGEQPLEIVLHERVKHAHHRRCSGRARARRCSTTRPGRRQDRRRCARSRRRRPSSSPRSSARRRGSAPPGGRAAARRAAARGRPSILRRSERGRAPARRARPRDAPRASAQTHRGRRARQAGRTRAAKPVSRNSP